MLPAPRRAIRPHCFGPARSRSPPSSRRAPSRRSSRRAPSRRSSRRAPSRRSSRRAPEPLFPAARPLDSPRPRPLPLVEGRLPLGFAGRPREPSLRLEPDPDALRLLRGRSFGMAGNSSVRLRSDTHWTGHVTARGLGRTSGRGQKWTSPAQWRGSCEKSGGVLLSQGHSAQVPSALEGLTSVFGMGTGVTLPLSPPKKCCRGDLHAAGTRADPSRQTNLLRPTDHLGRTRETELLENSIASTNIRIKGRFQVETKPSAD